MSTIHINRNDRNLFDLIDITRVAKVIERPGDRFLDRIFTDAERARAERTISRWTPMPRPWISRTSPKPRAAAAATYSATTDAVSPGRNGWRSRASSIGTSTGAPPTSAASSATAC